MLSSRKEGGEAERRDRARQMKEKLINSQK